MTDEIMFLPLRLFFVRTTGSFLQFFSFPPLRIIFVFPLTLCLLENEKQNGHDAYNS